MLNPKETIVYNVRDLSLHISHYIQGSMHEQMDDDGPKDKISRLQGMAIGFMYTHRNHQIIQKDFEKGMFISKSTASGLVKRMVKNGLIYTTPSTDDARVKCLNLTNHALDIMNEVDRWAKITEETLRRGIDQDELVIFFKVLNQIRENTK
ncbi:MarR family winged helix-turn-helix transcriptional regulator [Companilactobacillus kimchiensis]|uniref:HTH marR-type domain-containing protein n=1 Tax=Companilactobacillus kimchiensis TaxID=993692 RepID=A0A0R2LMJ5_9LACO|nr:helix-turn-helix domain-containing protein [Companilactobacillus kimchiensis]KRN99901.1 hypothetical protein IV57_GL002233 [Companilactobacillus kimchiensis]